MPRRDATRSIGRTLPLIVAVASAMVATPTAAAQDSFDASVRQLRRAISPRRDGSHLPLLLSLRQMRDRSLQPIFHRVAQHDHWQMQVHAVLGLAETDEALDPWLVARTSAEAQEAIIATALDTDLLDAPQMQELLEREELAPVPRLLLCAELLLHGDTVDVSTFDRLASSPRHRVAGFASMLLAKTGDGAAFSAFRDRLAELPRRDRHRRMLWLLEATRQYEIVALLPWVETLLDQPDLDREVAYWALYTAVVLDPRVGLRHWERALGDDPDDRARVRYGMLALAASRSLPPETFDTLAGESDLTRRMSAAGRAIASGADPTHALTALLDVRHPRTTEWVLSMTKNLPAEHSVPVFEHIVDNLAPDDPGRAERLSLAVGATSRLFNLEPARILQRLETVEDDGLAQEVLLLGLFDARSPAAGAAASSLRRIGAGRADTLALLLIARHADTLSPSDIERLGRIGAGGGRVSDGLQIQAAWLYLKHTNRIESALPKIFNDE